MAIGIYTHYAQCDQTYLALRLANFLRERGEEFSIYADNQPAKLKTSFDGEIVCRTRQPFTKWVADKTAIVWTQIPRAEQINYASNRGVTTILAPMWQELQTPFKKNAKQADHVVAMCTEMRELFQSVYRFKNITLIPYDTGLPITKKDSDVNAKSVKLFLPWFDRNARCTHSAFLDHLTQIVTYMPEVYLTVGVSSSKFSPAIAKFFKRLGATTGRVTLLRNVPVTARAKLYGAHDLTVFPAECDNYGLCSLTSITCGTPVITFAVSPQTDFVYPDMNGALVKTKIDYDEHGVAHAAPDYAQFAGTLQAMIAEPKYIDRLNTKINYNLNSRRKSFELGWHSILRLV
jgi:glycosyltransferase involved in cell wall biosynthesis